MSVINLSAGTPDLSDRSDRFRILHDLLVGDARSRRSTNELHLLRECDIAIRDAHRVIQHGLSDLQVHSPLIRYHQLDRKSDSDDYLFSALLKRRRIPISLFSTQVCSPPVTTIVRLSSLPISHRSNYLHKFTLDDKWDTVISNRSEKSVEENTLVEIPMSYLISDESEAADECPDQEIIQNNAKIKMKGLASHRPLVGNLSSKLVQYTRGQVGKLNPFRPGGIDSQGVDFNKSDNLNMTAANRLDSPHLISCTTEEKKKCLDALRKGSLASWSDKTLLTAPSGVPFSVGLHPKDFHPLSKIHREDTESKRTTILKERDDLVPEVKDLQTSHEARNSTVFILKPIPTVFDAKYLEDSSLFGDSDSESEEIKDSVSNSEGTAVSDILESTARVEGCIHSTDIVEASPEQNNSFVTDNDQNVQDIDGLLNDLMLSSSSSVIDRAIFLQKKKSDSANNTVRKYLSNPVHTSKELKNTLRKKKDSHISWAITSPVPIHDFHALVPNPAMTYPFELDDFQKQAVVRLERGECVFVAAHTSAGKTLCAEYAIALSRKHRTRAIYTSPIKALSNQKYRDFKEKFGDDVGLITGDVQLGVDASCLIMTTEILRSMLYRGADIVRDMEWVIFDEVHYINDMERGVVYEEVIIMLPDYVKLIFLSATTPNTVEFSEWIGRTKRKPVHVINTNHRPVPLSHYLYAGRKLHKIMEANSGFIEKGWSDAAKALIPSSERDKLLEGKKKGPLGGSKQGATQLVKPKSGSKESAWQQPGSKQEYLSLVKFLEGECLLPAVVFSFSKKKCEELANMLRTLDLNTTTEKSVIYKFTNQVVSRLSQSDAALPQVRSIFEMVRRGIGVHHGGLLPILKELIEILFSKNLIKILFATETFAMGVNMPAKAVVFNALRKHDGKQHRFLQPGEYVQMGGRAGRRGLDAFGTVIITCFGEEPPPIINLREILTGKATKLLSQFRLTYNMILNLLRVEDMSVESMIKRSFSEFATQRVIGSNEYPKLLARGLSTLRKLEEQFNEDADNRSDAEDIEDYYFSCVELLKLNKTLLTIMLVRTTSKSGGPLSTGRVLLVTAGRKKNLARCPAVVLKPPTVTPSNSSSSASTKSMICLVLLPETYAPNFVASPKVKGINYVGYARRRHYAIYEVELDEVFLVSDVKLKVDPSDFYDDDISTGRLGVDNVFSSSLPKTRDATDSFYVPVSKKMTAISDTADMTNKSLSTNEIISRLIEVEQMETAERLKIMDFQDSMKGLHQANDALKFRDHCHQMEMLLSCARKFQSHTSLNLGIHYAAVEKKETLKSCVTMLSRALSNESLSLFPDFQQRKSLLHSLRYIDENDTVCIKGRVACEVNTCEELIVTELVFEGTLNELEPAELVACLSALVFQEKNNEDELSSGLPDRVVDTCSKMKIIAIKLGHLQKNHNIPLDPEEYCESALKFGLVHVVYDWALGVPFSNICELTSVQEGSIVRCITRLDELCREVRNCSRVVGNPTLYRKLEEASAMIKRDIVFVSSLYVS